MLFIDRLIQTFGILIMFVFSCSNIHLSIRYIIADSNNQNRTLFEMRSLSVVLKESQMLNLGHPHKNHIVSVSQNGCSIMISKIFFFLAISIRSILNVHLVSRSFPLFQWHSTS